MSEQLSSRRNSGQTRDVLIEDKQSITNTPNSSRHKHGAAAPGSVAPSTHRSAAIDNADDASSVKGLPSNDNREDDHDDNVQPTFDESNQQSNDLNAKESEENQRSEEEEMNMINDMMKKLLQVEEKYKDMATAFASDRQDVQEDIQFDETTLKYQALQKELGDLIPESMKAVDEADVPELMKELKDVLLMESALKNSQMQSRIDELEAKQAEFTSAQPAIAEEQQRLKKIIEELREENARIAKELKTSQFNATESSFKNQNINEENDNHRQSSNQLKSQNRSTKKEVWSPQFELESNAFLYFSTKGPVMPAVPINNNNNNASAVSPLVNHGRLKPISAAVLKPRSSGGLIGSSSHNLRSGIAPGGSSMQKSVTRQVYKTAIENRQQFMEMIAEEAAAAAAAAASGSAQSSTAKKLQLKKKSLHNNNNNNYEGNQQQSSPPLQSQRLSSSSVTRNEFMTPAGNKSGLVDSQSIKNYRIKTVHNQPSNNLPHGVQLQNYQSAVIYRDSQQQNGLNLNLQAVGSANIFSVSHIQNNNSSHFQKKNSLNGGAISPLPPASLYVTPNRHSKSQKTFNNMFFDQPDLGDIKQ